MPAHVLLSYGLAVGLVLGLGAGGVVLARAWLRRPRRVYLLVFGLSALLLSGRCALVTRDGLAIEQDKLGWGRTLGLDYRAASDPNRFPAGAVAERLITGHPARAEVRAWLVGAYQRWECPQDEAEKYILAPGDGEAMVVNVWYDARNRVSRAQAGDSYDPLPLSRCRPT